MLMKIVYSQKCLRLFHQISPSPVAKKLLQMPLKFESHFYRSGNFAIKDLFIYKNIPIATTAVAKSIYLEYYSAKWHICELIDRKVCFYETLVHDSLEW